jgi:hypothetical protein
MDHRVKPRSQFRPERRRRLRIGDDDPFPEPFHQGDVAVEACGLQQRRQFLNLSRAEGAGVREKLVASFWISASADFGSRRSSNPCGARPPKALSRCI